MLTLISHAWYLRHRNACTPTSPPGPISTFLFVHGNEEVLPSGQAARSNAPTRRRKSNVLPPTTSVVAFALLHVSRPRFASLTPAVNPSEFTTCTNIRP